MFLLRTRWDRVVPALLGGISSALLLTGARVTAAAVAATDPGRHPSRDLAEASPSRAGRSVAAVTLVVLLGGCTGVGPESVADAPRATAATSPPANFCQDSPSVEQRVRDVVDAYNAGDVMRLDSFFAQETLFEWYSESPGRVGVEARNRATLAQYLSLRHAQGDRLTVERVDHTWGTRDFVFTLSRDSGPEFFNKGALDCRTGLIFVWSLGGPDGAGPGP